MMTGTRIRRLAGRLDGRFALDDDVLAGAAPLPAVGSVDAVRIARCARSASRAAARQRPAVA